MHGLHAAHWRSTEVWQMIVSTSWGYEAFEMRKLGDLKVDMFNNGEVPIF